LQLNLYLKTNEHFVFGVAKKQARGHVCELSCTYVVSFHRR